jgi:hypothetical protein
MFRLHRPARSSSEPELPLLNRSAASPERELAGGWPWPARHVLRARGTAGRSLLLPALVVPGVLWGLAVTAGVVLIASRPLLTTAMPAALRTSRSGAQPGGQPSLSAAANAAAMLQMSRQAGLLSGTSEEGTANSALAVAAAALASLASADPTAAGGELDGDDGGDRTAFSEAEPYWTAEKAASWAALRSAALAADVTEAPAPTRSGEAGPEVRRHAIAFCFLTRGPLPLAPVWHRFFAGAEDAAQYRIHVHAAPGFQLNASTVDSPLFHGTHINASVSVEWGQMSVVDAERRLFATALADPAVGWVVLLSESCVPLRPFPYVRSYLLGSRVSFLDSFMDVQGRYNPRMAPAIPPAAWRKGTQWAALRREHALAIVADEAVFAAMLAHCRTWTSPDGAYAQFCAGDEHYKQTLLVLLGRELETAHRPVTFANWWPINRSHPKQYVVQEVDAQLLEDLRTRRELWRPLEGEHLRCGTFGNATAADLRPCWLFARKFTQRAGLRMLEEHAQLLGF